MKKKVYYKLNRYQVTKVEVETVEQEQAVKMLNRDTDRFAKSEDTYRERYASLDEMYEESGFEPADDSPTPEEQFLENEKNEAIKRLVDEFANLPKFENIEGMVTVARSRGIRFLFVLQSYSQLTAKYGRDVGDIIKTNCKEFVP